MGNCCSACWPMCGNHEALCNFKIWSSNSRSDFSFLVEERPDVQETAARRGIMARIFRKRRSKQKLGSAGIMQGLIRPQLSYHRLPESQRVSPQSSYIKKDIQMQCLDARALLNRTSISTPDISLDLEWEHETLPVSSIIHDPSASSWVTSQYPWEGPDVNQSILGVNNTTESDCSRVSSSANSLEWDSVHNSIHSEVDVDMDTQFLLNEIDRLTLQALNETGIVVEDVGYFDEAL
ncbi:uncharacterized protein [Euwallacea fornicatus]|uniref:uncharacterized protein isoform X1 n=1 Tax=Euwallacea fornicatus TaxID=995702 RepID=UPI00338FA934